MKQILFTISTFLISITSLANNITVSNVKVVNQNTEMDYTNIKFDVSWENSWRTSTFESNWDAAWIFVKFRKKTEQNFYHAYLNNNGHVAPTGCVISPGLVNTKNAFNTVTNPAVGVFIHRDANGIGNVNFTDISIRWNYGANGLADNDSVEICVYAIEMVYIPQGSFKLGDNFETSLSTNSRNFFHAGGGSITPFTVTSENELTIGNVNNTQLWATAQQGVAGTLPANFPKGFAGFYIMKYELSQFMYKEFLLKLTRDQQLTRAYHAAGINRYMYGNTTTPWNRNGIKFVSDASGFNPRIYINDLNNNGIPNEESDGQDIACNYISFLDHLSFGDWCGLRPFTELEFEKACRGILNPVTGGEFPWGTTIIQNVTSITNPNTSTEIAGNASANSVYGNHGSVQGPMRSGNFARNSTSREQAGASYYGVMDLGGNLWEYVYTIRNTGNREFNGSVHGDGVLTSSGENNTVGWPTAGTIKGGAWNSSALDCNTSDRRGVKWDYTNRRFNTTGIRLSRSIE